MHKEETKCQQYIIVRIIFRVNDNFDLMEKLQEYKFEYTYTNLRDSEIADDYVYAINFRVPYTRVHRFDAIYKEYGKAKGYLTNSDIESLKHKHPLAYKHCLAYAYGKCHLWVKEHYTENDSIIALVFEEAGHKVVLHSCLKRKSQYKDVRGGTRSKKELCKNYALNEDGDISNIELVEFKTLKAFEIYVQQVESGRIRAVS